MYLRGIHITSHQEDANRNYSKLSFHTYQSGSYQKSRNNKCLQKCGVTVCIQLVETSIGSATKGNNRMDPQKLKIELIFLLKKPKEIFGQLCICTHTYTHTHTHYLAIKYKGSLATYNNRNVLWGHYSKLSKSEKDKYCMILCTCEI